MWKHESFKKHDVANHVKHKVEKDISQLAKPQIKGRGFIGSGQEIIETQTYYTQPENDWEFDEDQLLTYNNPVFVEQCKRRNKDFDKLNTGWVKQVPIGEEEEELIDDPEDDFEDDDFDDDEEDVLFIKNDKKDNKPPVDKKSDDKKSEDKSNDKSDDKPNVIKPKDTSVDDLKSLFDDDDDDDDSPPPSSTMPSSSPIVSAVPSTPAKPKLKLNAKAAESATQTPAKPKMKLNIKK